ncbi:MAG: heavy-metal-associated domain-containing protein [Lachnotalea sp.]
MKKKILIEGMSCEHCVNHVTAALKELSGVSGVEVNLTAKNAMIEADRVISDEEIKASIDEAGYEVIGIEVQ